MVSHPYREAPVPKPVPPEWLRVFKDYQWARKRLGGHWERSHTDPELLPWHQTELCTFKDCDTRCFPPEQFGYRESLCLHIECEDWE
jgi:hypothetical protein